MGPRNTSRNSEVMKASLGVESLSIYSFSAFTKFRQTLRRLRFVLKPALESMVCRESCQMFQRAACVALFRQCGGHGEKGPFRGPLKATSRLGHTRCFDVGHAHRSNRYGTFVDGLLTNRWFSASLQGNQTLFFPAITKHSLTFHIMQRFGNNAAVQLHPLPAASVVKKRRHLLLIDEKGLTTDALKSCFSARGYDAQVEQDGSLALQHIVADRPDLIIIETLSLGPDPLEIFREIRATTNSPIAILSSRTDSFDRVIGLEMGADEYLTKPLDPRVVLAHVDALLRRKDRDARPSNVGSVLTRGPFTASKTGRSASYEGVSLNLTSSDFDLFWILLFNYGLVVERSQLVRLLKIGTLGPTGPSIHGRAFRLRRKLQEAGAPSGIVKSVRGRGIILTSEESITVEKEG